MKVVLAYSGGLDTTFCTRYLVEHDHADVIAVTIDLGQKDDFERVAKRAKAAGAIKHILIDAKKEFVEDYAFKAVKMNALYEDTYPLHSSLQGYLIAKKIIEIARAEKADAAGHGNTGLGNDQFRYDVSFRTYAPDLKIIAPVREGSFTRAQEMEYLESRNIEVDRPKDKLFSIADNLWGSFLGDFGEAANPTVEAPLEVFRAVDRKVDPMKPVKKIKIGFKNGVPVSIDGNNMSGVDILASLNDLLGKYGYGWIDYIESSVYGTKIRQTVEGPAALALILAHKDLERLVLTRRQLSLKPLVEQKWTEHVFEGLLMDPICRDIEAFVDSSQKRVEGWVMLEIRPHVVYAIARDSKLSLYRKDLYSYDDVSIEHKKGEAFSELWGKASAMAFRIGQENNI